MILVKLALTPRIDSYSLCDPLRAYNYRPWNPYRDRFFGDDGAEKNLPGAIPIFQRPSPLPKELSLEDRSANDSSLAWEAGWEKGWEEREGEKTRHNIKSTRKLQTSTAQPSIEHPLSCISQGDSVLFDISSGCHPVYEKDSLLNSNLK